MLTPLVSLLFGGPSISEQNDVAPGEAVLGRPVWDARVLLEQLELRLGLPRIDVPDMVRLQQWSSRLRDIDHPERQFYWASYATDPLGTARALLEWRDELVFAGWDGQPIPGGGQRLQALAELERGLNLSEVAPGAPDRLRAVHRELESLPAGILEALELAEERALWPELWRRVFAQLEACGVAVRTHPPVFPSNPAENDLGRMQAVLRNGSPDGAELTGDGSLLWLEGETSWELAQAAAALLRAEMGRSMLVVRSGDVSALNAALATQALPSQGLTSRSGWRPALQVLPLALELTFAPRDPQRVFELVTLPRGPFMGKIGYELAKTLANAPGIGGKPWLDAKERLRLAGVDDVQMQSIGEWLEGPSHHPSLGAPKGVLRDVTRRVRDWIEAELNRGYAALADASTDTNLEQRLQVLGAASIQARAFEQALEYDKRETLGLIEVRHLLEETAGAPHGVELAVESAGRIDHVARPAAVRAGRDIVLWWYCAAGTERQARPSPWRAHERRASSAAGVRLIDPNVKLAAEAQSWLAPVFAAQSRLIFAVPRSALGTEIAPHPVLDEIAGRARARSLQLLRIHCRDWLADGPRSTSLKLDRDRVSIGEVLELPPARAQWTLAPGSIPEATAYSASAMEALAGCPLKWVLRHRAGLYPASNRAIPSGPTLNGNLGHRLIEALHAEGVLGDPERCRARSRAVIDELVAREAGVLSCWGKDSERVQLAAQLCGAVDALAALIAGSSLRIVGVEKDVRASWRDRDLTGRIDLLLADRSGREIILDLKWGSGRYSAMLTQGRAVQLAIYARVRHLSEPALDLPRCGYFCLSNGKVLGTELECLGPDGASGGPTSLETWQRLETTIAAIELQLRMGRVAVTGVSRSLPIAADAEAPANDGGTYLPFERGAACEYCDYAAICGRSWEAYA